MGETTAGLYVGTEQKKEFFFTPYCFVAKPTSVQEIKPPR